jgi:hypothetical protein
MPPCVPRFVGSWTWEKQRIEAQRGKQSRQWHVINIHAAVNNGGPFHQWCSATVSNHGDFSLRKFFLEHTHQRKRQHHIAKMIGSDNADPLGLGK